DPRRRLRPIPIATEWLQRSSVRAVNDRPRAARPPSLWLDPPPTAGPSLEGALHADVIVIGAGYTGLWTALGLRERGADVVVLERDYAGFGASGRNAGHLTPTI